MRTRIKFCGFTRVADVRAACALGIDAVGLIFAARSARRLSLDAARALRAAVPPMVSVVALVMDTEVDAVRRIVQVVRPHLLQFHGSESEADCRRHGVSYLKAVPMAGEVDPQAHVDAFPSAAGFVFDAHAAGGVGGSGECFDWTRLPRSPAPLVLAGGLDAGNVGEAIHAVRPYAVDVASGIESAPGEKDMAKMQAFVDEVRRADAD